MLILELFSDEDSQINETKMAWGRRGNKVVRKYRCTIGRLKGKTVSSPGANPASKRVQALNKR